MKSNSSKNRKANLPKILDEKPQGVNKSSDDKKKKKDNEDKNSKNLKNLNNGRELNFLDEIKKLDKEVYIHNVDMTKRLFDEQMKQFTKNQNDELKRYESMLIKQKLNKTDFIALMNAKKYQQNLDLGKQQQELYDNFGLTKKTEEFTKTDKTIGKIDDFLEKFDGKVEKVLDKNNKAIKGAWLGSLNLITAPLEDFFGFDTMEVFKMALGIGSKTKKRPTASDVQKKGDAGALFINNTIEEIFGKDKKKKDKKNVMGHILETLNDRLLFLPKAIMSFVKGIPILGMALRGIGLLGKSFSKNMLGAGGNIGKFLASGATKTALKSISPLAIITSIISMVVDGFKGLFKSKEWQTSKISGFLGGVFGGTDSGVKGTFKGLGKFAMLGLAVAGPVGALVGGIVGAVFGAIGGKRIANFLDWASQSIKNFFIETIGGIWKDNNKNIAQKLGATCGALFKAIGTLPIKILMASYNGIKNYLLNKKSKKEQEKQLKKAIKKNKIFSVLWDSISKGFKNIIKSFLKNPILFIGTANLKIMDKIVGIVWDFVGGFVNSVFGTNIISYEDFKNEITDKIKINVLEPLFNMFGVVKDFFDMIIHDPKLIGKAIFDKNFTLLDAFDEYSSKKVEKVNDAIIKKDGTIIRTSEDDNLIATKNDPSKITSMSDFNSDRLKDVFNGAKNIVQIDYTKQLGTMINLLEKLLDKEVVTVNNNEQSLSDLQALAGGFHVGY